MPDAFSTESTESTEPTEPTEPPATRGWWKSLHLGTSAALVIAVVAAGIAIAGWFRPPHDNASHTFTDQQTAEAKANVCTAYLTVQQAVVTNTHLVNPGGDNPIGTLAVAANARLALLGGGVYLRDRVAAQPAAPADLANAVNSMAKTIDELGINYLAGVPGSSQDPLRHDLDSQIAQIDGLCA